MPGTAPSIATAQGFPSRGYAKALGRQGGDPMQIMRAFYFPCFFCRWNETFQKEVVQSRLESTQMLAKAITEAPQPPQAWVLVTGVGMPPSHHPLYTGRSKAETEE